MAQYLGRRRWALPTEIKWVWCRTHNAGSVEHCTQHVWPELSSDALNGATIYTANIIDVPADLSSPFDYLTNSDTDAGQRWHVQRPSVGRRYEVFNERPLKPKITEYCKQAFVLVPDLYGVYNTKLRQTGQASWRIHVRERTKDRIKLLQSLGYEEKSNGNALGWNDQIFEEKIESWNEEVIVEALAG